MGRALLLAAAAAAASITTGAAAAAAAGAAAGAGADPACMQASSATHFMAFVVPETGGSSGSGGVGPILHAPKVSQ